MKSLAVLEESWTFTLIGMGMLCCYVISFISLRYRLFFSPFELTFTFSRSSHGADPPYPVYGGVFREEAIMLLRRFYVQENEKGER